MNGKPEECSDYLSESLCRYIWQSVSSKGGYLMILALIDATFEEWCDECEKGDCDDCQKEPQINEGFL